MQFSAIIVTIMASMALATPTKPVESRGGISSSYEPCGSSVLLYSEAACCSGDVLNLLDLTCESVSSTPSSADDFASICSESGKTAECCTLGVATIDLVCKTPAGL